MILGIKFELNNELYIKMDLSEYVKIEDKIANVHLPERVKPAITDSSYLNPYSAHLDINYLRI